MHDAEVLAYTGDGEIYCDDCGWSSGMDSEELTPIFATDENEVIGATCGTCRACYVLGNGWTNHADATNKQYTRWAICRECNHHLPVDKNDWQYSDLRLAALRNDLHCRNCAKPTMHF